MIHKKILDAAESEPDASMAEIADGITGASVELVERVLEEYGDPAGDVPDSQVEIDEPDRPEGTDRHGAGDSPAGAGDEEGSTEPGGHDMGTRDDQDETEESPQGTPERETLADENGRSDEDYTDLSEKQLRTLRLIERNPEATQGELAAEFDVTRATVSRWLSDIDGFEWPRRLEHAARILNGDGIGETDERTGSEGSGSGATNPPGSGSDREHPARSDDFERRLDGIERRLDQLVAGSGTETGTAGIDPELAHKVVHACLNSDRISEEEELRVLKQLMA